MDNQKNNDFDNSNIFDELTKDIDLENTVKKMKEESEKDIYDHLSFYSWIIKSLNFLLLLFIIFALAYIFIQKSDKLNENWYLNLLCPILLWESSNFIEWNCSSVTSFKTSLSNTLISEKKSKFDKIVTILPDAYSIWNLSKSKEVTFLLNNTTDRLKVLQIIQEFDKLKNEYDSVDKNKIKCQNILIDDDFVLNAKCSAYSSYWDESILWFDWNDKNSKVSWTSISVANSFLNYVQTKTSNFTLLSKQKNFSIESVIWNWFYTYKTDFDIKMKYNWSNLSF